MMGFKKTKKMKKTTKKQARRRIELAGLLDELGGSLVGLVDASFVALRLQGGDGGKKQQKTKVMRCQ